MYNEEQSTVELASPTGEPHSQHEELEKAPEQRSRYFDLYDQAPVGYVTLSQKGLILEANFTASTLLGVARGELVDQPLSQFIASEDQPSNDLQDQWVLETGASEPFELRMLRRDKTQFWAQLVATSAYDEAGSRLCLLVFLDISKRKQAEKDAQELESQRFQSKKMLAVGQLAGGIAHDFNNILAAMIMQLGMLRHQPKVDPPALAQAVGALSESANRAASLVRQLLLFSRQQTMKTTRFDANAVIFDLTQLVERLLGDQVTLALEPSEQSLWIQGDAGMISQVAMNLCINARDAMPKGGRLTVSTRPVLLDLDTTRRYASVEPGCFVCLCVSDTGTGIENGVIEHIFEPFFTTKAQGKGVGLGLATVDGIIAKHGGFVEVASQPGKGSSFSVYLPCLEPAGASVQASNQDSKALPGGNERLLVVEDEASVRRIAVKFLRQLGYHVTEAANGVEALRIWKEDKGKFDLLFSDMVMPEGISGLDLCIELKQMKTELPMIITSGYSADVMNDVDAVAQNVTFLSKPYEISVLASTIRSCLDKAVVKSELEGAGWPLVRIIDLPAS